MSRGPNVPSPLSPCVRWITFFIWCAVIGLVICSTVYLAGCARAGCPPCAPLVVCDQYHPPESSAGAPVASPQPDWEPMPAPSGSAVP